MTSNTRDFYTEVRYRLYTRRPIPKESLIT